MVTKNRLILILGLWIALIPYLGFPSSFKTLLIIGSGLLVALFAFLLARDRHRPQNVTQNGVKQVKTDVYAENGPAWNNKEIFDRRISESQ